MTLPEMLAPFAATRQKLVTVALTAPLVNQSLDLGAISVVCTIQVIARTGAGTATLKWNVVSADAVDYPLGKIDNNIAVNALILNSDGAGGSVTYLIQGV